MSLDWLPSDKEIKNHDLWGKEYFSKEPPSVIYELKPVIDNEGKAIKGLNSLKVISISRPQNSMVQYGS